jgi:hypothetical protein
MAWPNNGIQLTALRAAADADKVRLRNFTGIDFIIFDLGAMNGLHVKGVTEERREYLL